MSEPLKFKTPTPTSPATIEPIPLNARDQKVWDILLDSEEDADVLALKFNVSHQTIRNVKMGKTAVAARLTKTMKHLGCTVYTWKPARRFTEGQVLDIRRNTKASHVVAKYYNCSPSTIRMIKSGQTYKED